MTQQTLQPSGGLSRPPAKPQRAKIYKRPFALPRTVAALMLREMSSTFGRTPFGFLWVVLEPVAAIALLTAVFSLAIREPALGSSFQLFYATGFLPFFTFLSLTSKIGSALVFSRALLAYPSVTWLDAIVARFVLNFLADLLVAVIVFGGILFIWDVRVIMDLPTILMALLMAGSFALGVGMMNCYLFMKFPSWQRMFSILMRPMFFMSCIFFLFETVPQPYRDWLWWNPIVHITGMMRRGFYATYQAEWVSLGYFFGVSFTLMALALLMLRRTYQDLLDK